MQAGGQQRADPRVQRGAGNPRHLHRRLAAVEARRHDHGEAIGRGKRHARRHAADGHEVRGRFRLGKAVAAQPQPSAFDDANRLEAGQAPATRLSVVVQFEVPVQVVAPALGRAAQADRDADRRRRHRPPRRADQPHARLVGRASALAPVARHAAGDDVLPVLAAALRHRHHVIERELWCREDVGAVLAGEFVARVDVGARERHVIEALLDADVAQQPDDRGQLEGKRDRADLAVVMRDDLDLALAPQRHRLLPVDDLQRLVGCVEEERLLHLRGIVP